MPEYPPLPGPYCWEFREPYERYTADQMHAYLAAERQRIEREVAPLLEVFEEVAMNKYDCIANDIPGPSLSGCTKAILRAIRGEVST